MATDYRVKKFTFNVSPIQFEDAEVRIGIFDYDENDADQLRNLRTAYGSTHVFLRDGSRVLSVPFTSEADDVGQQFDTIQLQSHLGLCAALFRNAFCNFLHSRGTAIYKHRPLTFNATLAKHNMLARALEPRLQCPDWLAVYPLCEADIRVFRFDKRPPFVGMALNIRTTRRIDRCCSELLAQGFSPIGLYVGRMVASLDSRLQPHLELLGRVSNVAGTSLLLADTREDGPNSINADDAMLQRGFDAFNRCINLLFDSQAEQVKASLERQLTAFRMGPARLEKLCEAVQYLGEVKLELIPGVPATLLPLLSSEEDTFPSLDDAPGPVYVFDPTGVHTARWHDGGLRRFGPYTAQTFDKNKPRICIICQATRKGQVDQFLRKFSQGISLPKNPKAPYKQGFIRKYKLEDIAVQFFPTADDTPTAYRRAVQSAIEWQQDRNTRWDLALIQIEDRFHNLQGEENPYLIAKMGFLTHQIPTQEFTIETMALPEGRLSYALNNMALATYAKLGGTPWLIKASPTITHELVIGIGSASVGEGRLGNRERVVGITTVFSGDGNYQLSNLTRSVPFAEYREALLDCLRRAVTKVQQSMNWQPQDQVRLVFHAFKPFKNTEVEAVKSLMAELGEYDVDYAFLHVIDDHSYFLFDTEQLGVLDYQTHTRKGAFAPDRGGYLRLSQHGILLILTGPKDIKRPEDGMPRPVLLRLHRESTFKDTTYLARQAFTFACHSWRSFFPASFPVTILYSDLIAGLLGQLAKIPRWNPDALTDRIERTRWFL